MPIVPNMQALAGLSGQRYSIDAPGLVANASTNSDHATETGRAAEATLNNGLEIKAGSGSGIWVPYLAGRLTYGYANAGSTWMGTGPFSGCHIAFFTEGGRIGLAHIAKDSGKANSTAAWDAFKKRAGVTVLNEWKIGLPDQAKYSASNVFLDLSNPKSVGLVQVDVHVITMGGENGTIFGVKKVL